MMSAFLGLTLLVGTGAELLSFKTPLTSVLAGTDLARITDRHGVPLSTSYQNRWNSADYLPLHQIPDLLIDAFVISEDQHFYQHHGVDWAAMGSAIWHNLRSFDRARGASTITEQVVRILHERPRTLWSKWLEMWEALLLEKQASKAEILEFYVNELPYASHRRGVSEAAHHYFNRDLSLLTPKELLALVVLARAPSNYDLYRNPSGIEPLIHRLADQMLTRHQLTASQHDTIVNQSLALESLPPLPDASHFVQYVRNHFDPDDRSGSSILHTTLESSLQEKVAGILKERLKSLAHLSVHNAAVLIIDHRSAEILAWVVAGGDDSEEGKANNQIDAVTIPRQPGSAMKPFLYARALDKGWTAATLIDDSPMAEVIGSGLHEFKNYSHTFYGPISLREALGNSLNIPALRTIEFVGVDDYLRVLHALGFNNLTEDASIYKDGLALGNGEVSLFEMAQAYTALAHGGFFRPLRFLLEDAHEEEAYPVYSPEAASLIGNILSDPWARRLEFGYGSVLNLPIQTAVKTGTSTDYNDAWTMGFDSRYVVGIWMGNLDHRPMDGVTGAVGPALVLRSVFAELHQDQDTAPLFLSSALVKKDLCLPTSHEEAATSEESCYTRTEYFLPGSSATTTAPSQEHIALTRPSQGLQMAYDPRMPADHQIFSFKIEGLAHTCSASCQVRWYLNDQLLGVTKEGRYHWPVQRGSYQLRAEVHDGPATLFESGPVHFTVK